MKTISLLLRVLAILGAGVAIAGWVATNNKVKEANLETKKVRAEAATAKNDASDFEQRFKAADSKSKSLESDISDAKSRAQSARSQLAEAQRNLTSVRSTIKEKEQTINSLESQNTKLKEEIISMRTDVPDVDSSKVGEYENQIADLNDQVSRLKNELANMTVSSVTPGTTLATGDSTVATGATDVAAAATTPTAPQLPKTQATTAHILKADVSSGIVVIDRGQKAGLQEQMEFAIAKGYDKPVRIKVAKTAPTYSMAYILPGSEGAKFADGDVVQLIQ